MGGRRVAQLTNLRCAVWMAITVSVLLHLASIIHWRTQFTVRLWADSLLHLLSAIDLKSKIEIPRYFLLLRYLTRLSLFTKTPFTVRLCSDFPFTISLIIVFVIEPFSLCCVDVFHCCGAASLCRPLFTKTSFTVIIWADFSFTYLSLSSWSLLNTV